MLYSIENKHNATLFRERTIFGTKQNGRFGVLKISVLEVYIDPRAEV